MKTRRSGVALAGALTFLAPLGAEGQGAPSGGRDLIRELDFPALDFHPPQAQKLALAQGIPVFFIEDHSLPLVSVYARFRGGYSLLPRERYGAASALPSLLFTGGTTSLSPDSVDALIDFYALQLSFGGGGESTFASLNTLTRHLDEGLALWGDMFLRPRFDAAELEVWRGQQAESVRRRKDDPGRLAYSEFNRLMFGDHPIGWEMDEADLDPGRLSTETLLEVHHRIFCRENLILGVVGDVSWPRVRPLLEAMAEGIPGCDAPLPEAEAPVMREGGGVFLIPRELPQSTVVMAQVGGVSQGATSEYFASRIGNAILGAGGFSSRLVSRVRTEAGYAYSASSIWTAPARWEGIVGAVTQTKSESTVAAIQLILETMEEMRAAPPHAEEMDRAVAQMVNGFVFNFQDPSQVVSRQMFYLAQGLPEDWLEEYIRGIQRVRARDVQEVFRRYVRPEEMVILILGNPERFDAPPEVLGPVRIWDVEGVSGVGAGISGSPRAERRSPR